MQYDIDKINPSAKTRRGMQTMLMAKFEETMGDPTEDLYNNYARKAICNRRRDTKVMEHEQARGPNTSYGMLNLRYNGHRGTADDPYMPERFNGFIGPDERETRRLPGPDMSLLRAQQEARMRFIRFGADGPDREIDPMRTERQVQRDKQTWFKEFRRRLRVFSRGVESRGNKRFAAYNKKSRIGTALRTFAYGDLIGDTDGMQRRSQWIIKNIIRDSRLWRDTTNTADMGVATYTQFRRQVRQRGTDSAVGTAVGDSAEGFRTGDTSRAYKTVALLMSDMIRAKKLGAANNTTDLAESADATARKTAPIARDLASVLAHINSDAEATASQTAANHGRIARAMAAGPGRPMRDAVTPAHLKHNAVAIYKSVRAGRDMRAVKNSIITDGAAAAVIDDRTRGKAAAGRVLTGAKLGTVAAGARTHTSMTTHSYKSLRGGDGEKNRINGVVAGFTAGTSTRARMTQHQRYAKPGESASVIETRGDNTIKDRRAGGLGSKYTVGQSLLETSTNSFSGGN